MKSVLFAFAAGLSLALTGAALAQTAEGQAVQPPPPQAQEDRTLSGEADTQSAPTPPDATAEVPPKEAAENAEAMAASPAPRADAVTAAAVTTPDTASAVCQPRVTSLHFGRASALSQENRNAIEHAVDAASVCTLQSVVIADSADGRASAHRAEAVRTTLVRRGVPRQLISIENAAKAEGASTGQLDVRMNFTGLASASGPAATDEAEPTPPPAS